MPVIAVPHAISVEPVPCDVRGRVRAVCPCGWRSISFGSEGQARQIGEVHLSEMVRIADLSARRRSQAHGAARRANVEPA